MKKELEIDNFVDRNYELPNDDEEEEEEYYQEDEERELEQALMIQNDDPTIEAVLSNQNEIEPEVNMITNNNQQNQWNQQQIQERIQPQIGGFRQNVAIKPFPFAQQQQQQLSLTNPQLMMMGQGGNSANGGGNMNLHQHFNQPNILNFTQNSYFNSPYNQPPQMFPQSNSQQQTLPQMQKSGTLKMQEDQLQQSSSLNQKRRRPTSAFPKKDEHNQRQQNFVAYNMNGGGNQRRQTSNINDFQNDNYRRKIIPQQMIYDKEDLYDQNLILKININDVRDENMRVKTRLTMMSHQLKEKDQLINDLYKSAFITAAGTPAKSNLNKEILMNIKLKKKVFELRDVLAQREFELFDLKKTLKSTKLKELELETKVYMQECVRLRAITEHAIKMSGEIDLERIKKQTIEYTESMNQRYLDQEKQLESASQEIQKVQNVLQQSQLDIKQQNQVIDNMNKTNSRLQTDIVNLKQEAQNLKEKLERKISDREKTIEQQNDVIGEKELEIKKLQKSIKDLKEKLKETEKMIPKRPEKEYIEELNQKNQKIEDLLDELLQRDTLIDKQAVLNKDIQKKCDQQKNDILQFIENQKMYQNQIDDERNKKQELEQKIKQLLQKMQDNETANKQKFEKTVQDFEDQIRELNDQLDFKDSEKQNLLKVIEEKDRLLREIPIVQKSNDSVKEGLERLRRLCQIRGKLHDQIENILFDNDYRPEAKISIKLFTQIVENKLQMTKEKALLFARYLIEPQDVQKLEFNEERTVAACKIIIKLMNQVGDIQLFHTQDFENMKDCLGQVFSSKESLLKVLFQNLDLFREEMHIEQVNQAFQQKELQREINTLSVDKPILEILFVEQLKQQGDIYSIKKQELIDYIEKLCEESKLKNKLKEEALKQKHVKQNSLQKKLSKQEEEKDADREKESDYPESNRQNLKGQPQTSSQPDLPTHFRQSQEEDIQEAVQEPRQILTEILKENGKDMDSQEQVDSYLDQVEDFFSRLSNEIDGQNTTLRKLLNKYIYTVKIKDKETNEKKEVEVIRIVDFLNYLTSKFPDSLEKEEDFILEYVFGSGENNQEMKFEQLVKTLKSYQIFEDVPKSKKHLDFNKLDLKSIRILNRISQFLAERKIDADTFFDDTYFSQTVKTKTKTEKVDLMKAEQFFKKLQKNGIVKKSDLHLNLCSFLCIDDTYMRSLMYKKLRRYLEILPNCSYFKMIGTKKRKLKDILKYQEDEEHSQESEANQQEDIRDEIISNQKKNSEYQDQKSDQDQNGYSQKQFKDSDFDRDENEDILISQKLPPVGSKNLTEQNSHQLSQQQKEIKQYEEEKSNQENAHKQNASGFQYAGKLEQSEQEYEEEEYDAEYDQEVVEEQEKVNNQAKEKQQNENIPKQKFSSDLKLDKLDQIQQQNNNERDDPPFDPFNPFPIEQKQDEYYGEEYDQEDYDI